MIEETRQRVRSRELAVRLYDTWVRDRQKRPDIGYSDDPKDIEELARINHKTQLVEPRRLHLAKMKEVAREMTIADRVALLVMMELPALETSALLHRLSRQLAEDPEAKYFSVVNQADNCGCGCGCCCGAMASLPYEEQISTHHMTKPYSIDPFNEVETPTSERDSLLIRDFLESHESLSQDVSTRINSRYHHMGREFG